MDAAVDRRSLPLRYLLFLTVAVPAIVVSWGFSNGRLVFVLYREPKLIAVMVLGWTLISAWLWHHRNEITSPEVRDTLRRQPIPVLAAFLAYLSTTGLWVWVPQNFWYELNQYLLLFALLIALLMWQHRDPSVAETVRSGLVISLAVVTVVGIFQAVAPLSFLSPINPEIGAANPSFMGYKNPAALAVLGQIFLLAGLVFADDSAGRLPRRRLLLGGLLAAELVYLASLGSRTALLGLVAAVLFTVVLWWARDRSLQRARQGLLMAAAIGLLCGAVIASDPDKRRRATSMIALAAHPAAFLDSDRGTYLLNTLDMVRHHPMGVGLGDWQTHYPVHRPHQPSRSFSAEFQVRRAHSDHVQFLGEAGWPGLGLWAAFLLILVWTTTRTFLTTGRGDSLFAAAQLVAFAAAMTTDYVIELPYLKLQFFLVVFLAIQTRRSQPRWSPGLRPGVAALAALSVTAIAIGQIALHAGLARRLHTAAHLERSYSAATGETDPRTFVRPFELGLRFASGYGHTKTQHKDWLLVADSARRVGRSEIALAATRKALDLHPTYAPAYLLMAKLELDPETSRRWLRTSEALIEGSAGCPFDSPPLDLSSPPP